MTVRIFQSHIAKLPVETHENDSCTVLDWLQKNVRRFKYTESQPIVIIVDGNLIEIPDWEFSQISSESDVRIYPAARGIEVAFWAMVVIAGASLIYTLTLDTDGPKSRPQGERIDDGLATANTVRLYDPVPEILGKFKTYPDYIGTPVTRFANKRDMVTTMALCVGSGSYQIQSSSLKIGDTPFAMFGPSASATIYEPGDDVSLDSRFDNWYVVVRCWVKSRNERNPCH